MPGYPGGIWHGDQGPPPPTQVLGEAEDGGADGRLLRRTLPWRERDVTQRDPLLPTIFNVVVDAVVCHWEYLVAEREGGDTIDDNRDAEQTAGRTIQDLDNGRQRDEEGNQRLTVKAELFYTNNGMVAYTDPDWLQLEFDMMTGLFDRVGLRKNVRKNVGIV